MAEYVIMHVLALGVKHSCLFVLRMKGNSGKEPVRIHTPINQMRAPLLCETVEFIKVTNMCTNLRLSNLIYATELLPLQCYVHDSQYKQT